MLADLRKVLPLRLQIASLFLFVMWLFFQAYQPYKPIDTDLLLDSGQFNNATDLFGWSRESGRIKWSDDTGYVSLQSGSRLRYALPVFSGDMFLAAGRITTDAVQVGRYSWDVGRIMLYFEDADGNIMWHHPHNVGFLDGTSDWKSFAAIIDVHDFAQRGWIELANTGISGVVSFDDVSVMPAVWKKTYAHWQMTFGMLWAAIMMWLVLNTHFWDSYWGRALLLTALVIIVGVTLPPSTMMQVTSSGASITNKVFSDNYQKLVRKQPSQNEAVEAAAKTREGAPQAAPESAREDTVHVTEKTVKTEVEPHLKPLTLQKIGHPALFAVLSFLAFMAFPQKSRRGVLIYSLLLFAVSTEVLQLVVDGRKSQMDDLLLDLLGMLAGIIVMLAVRFMLRPEKSQTR